MSRRSFLASSFMLAGSYAMAACSRHNEAINNLINSGTNGNQDENNGNTESKVNPFDFEKKTVMLNSGYEMPIIGIGTYLLSTAQAEESVYNALHSGMRLIDTADIYGNERGVARGIQRAMADFGIRREDIFVTSKLWTSSFNRADEEVDERLERLELEYVDLLLLHHAARDDEHAYQAMERGVRAGKLHSIGISNFYEDAVLQNETHLYHQSRSVKAHIAPLGTILESWFPLGGRGRGIRTLTEDETVAGIASAHGKSSCQILLRWQLQTGNIAIPGSTNAAHIAEDYDIFNFELTDAEMQQLNGLDRNQRFASY